MVCTECVRFRARYDWLERSSVIALSKVFLALKVSPAPDYRRLIDTAERASADLETLRMEIDHHKLGHPKRGRPSN